MNTKNHVAERKPTKKNVRRESHAFRVWEGRVAFPHKILSSINQSNDIVYCFLLMICYTVYNMTPALLWPSQAINVRINILFKFTHGTLFKISGYDGKEVAVGGLY